jgi:hypothetical protein
MIHRAERFDAIATSQMVRAWALGESRFHPSAHTAIKVDSRKKAAVASIARREQKNIPHKLRVPGPVGSKLEFQGDAGYYSDDKINKKNFTLKFCHPLVSNIFGYDVPGFHDGKKN